MDLIGGDTQAGSEKITAGQKQKWYSTPSSYELTLWFEGACKIFRVSHSSCDEFEFMSVTTDSNDNSTAKKMKQNYEKKKSHNSCSITYFSVCYMLVLPKYG